MRQHRSKRFSCMQLFWCPSGWAKTISHRGGCLAAARPGRGHCGVVAMGDWCLRGHCGAVAMGDWGLSGRCGAGPGAGAPMTTGARDCETANKHSAQQPGAGAAAGPEAGVGNCDCGRGRFRDCDRRRAHGPSPHAGRATTGGRSGGGTGSRSGQLRLRPGPRPRLRPATRPWACNYIR